MNSTDVIAKNLGLLVRSCSFVAMLLPTCLFGKPQQPMTDDILPPVAQAKPHELTTHGHTRIDEFYWMRDRENQEVIDYLLAENEFLKAKMSSTEALQSKLIKELKGRIKLTDSSVPTLDRGFWYYVRTDESLQYPIYCRKSQTLESEEQVMLDVNQVAEGQAYCSVVGVDASPNGKILAYGVDFVGRRKYSLRFKDLDTGELLADEIADVTGNFEWAEDNETLFYARQDPETLRSYQIFRHKLGTSPDDDILVYEEQDEEFSCYVFKTKSRKFMLIHSSQTVSDEVRFIPAERPEEPPILFTKRERDFEYDVDHIGNRFVIRTNWDEKNFRMMSCPEELTTKEHWQVLATPRDGEFFQGFELFDTFCAIQKRRDALTHIELAHWEGDTFAALSDAGRHELNFGEPCYVARISDLPESNTPWLRYAYSSLTTPSSVYEYHIETREKRLLKQQEILGDFDRENYQAERRFVTARDGTKVPVSIVYRKSTPIDGTAPCLQYGYGSYGASMDAGFDHSLLSLLDRGFVYAIAHIRGGQELGREWYEDGKLLKKRNTFYDFIDVGKYLIENKFAAPGLLFAQGGSAGGLLVGAVINFEPSLYHGVVADVPFVDVVTTMLDETIPLTTSEYDEWGNPNIREYYEYMLSYSPYDNLQRTAYPHMLVTSGLHDSQVQYWEPTKWVARLRNIKTDNNLLLLKTNMEAGHGGASARDERFKETALTYAFILMLSGILD